MKKRILFAENIGFCFGVRNAVAMAEKILKAHGVLYSKGDIVHNPCVMRALAEKGLRTVERLPGIGKGPFLIRSHGLPPRIVRQIEKRGVKVYNATCPSVKKVQNLVKSLDGDGYSVIIIGDAVHPEVQALRDCGENVTVCAPGTIPRLRAREESIAVVGQTTLSFEEYATSIRHILSAPAACRVLKIFNTICKVTEQRQAASRTLSKRVDAVLVPGGKKSANTTKLFQVCRTENPATFRVESVEELKTISWSGVNTIGITSGTSTSEEFIRSVVAFLKNKGYGEVL